MAINFRRGLTPKIQSENAKDMKKISQKKDVDDSGSKINFNHTCVCITGTIPGMTRKEAQIKLLQKFPNVSFHDSMRSSTDYLITGFGIGQSKLQAAQRYGIPIIEATKLFN
jgi:NAD-dependent DNA ligase